MLCGLVYPCSARLISSAAASSVDCTSAWLTQISLIARRTMEETSAKETGAETCFIGTAPLYLLIKALRIADPSRRIETHLGFREEAYLKEEFAAISDKVQVNIGGYVTADVDFTRPATYYACGPTPMLKAAMQAAEAANAQLYVSLEKHMACGVGACLGCTCKTTKGQKRICKEGPVFPYLEVYDAI